LKVQGLDLAEGFAIVKAMGVRLSTYADLTPNSFSCTIWIPEGGPFRRKGNNLCWHGFRKFINSCFEHGASKVYSGEEMYDSSEDYESRLPKFGRGLPCACNNVKE
jgi:hypothetical protein